MIEKLKEINSQLIKMEDDMAAWIGNIPFDMLSRCGFVATIALLSLLLLALFTSDVAQASNHEQRHSRS